MRVAAVVLAAGQGTRMASHLPKVLHEVAGRPMIGHVLRAISAVRPVPDPIVVVVGHEAAQVTEAVGGAAEVVVQSPQRGTADAVRCAEPLLSGQSAAVLVVYGDVPLLRAETLTALLDHHEREGPTATLLTMELDDPAGYGRVVRDEAGGVARIVEATDASSDELRVREVNSGVGVWEGTWLWPALAALEPAASGEFYLTDLVARAVEESRVVAALRVANSAETLGVNSRADLSVAEGAVRERIRQRHMAAGVTLVTPGAVWIDDDVRVGRDTVVWPNTFLMGSTVVGEGATLGPGAVIRDSDLGDGVKVELSVVEGARLGAGCRVGPFSHIREGSGLDVGVHIGNYAEVKGSELGRGVRASHFSYIGDADVGERVNIGAGTVTANYDGVAKHRTVIGAGAFIGSGSVLVAPVSVGAGAVTGAGSVVTRDVAPGVTVVGVPAKPLATVDGDAA